MPFQNGERYNILAQSDIAFFESQLTSTVCDVTLSLWNEQVQWLFGQCLSVLQERGAEMAEYDRDADLLQMLLFY